LAICTENFREKNKQNPFLYPILTKTLKEQNP